ncbi:MAG: aminotransferase [Candidatus Anoxymicrobium japonicum]|uniref:Aminotransferase n=1 Tax=Candidatus Anoxymicrobium japonicum TaxID=2013648 RepID=A0A2N3G4W7_9ACTN|nr:MAG: aminotransferase [Candidatus Anoxymicrobium japonicum]
MSREIIFDPYTRLYSEASSFMRCSAVRDLMSVIGRSDIISFAGGLPYLGGLPPENISEIMNSVLDENMSEAFQYGETEGRDDLRSALVEVMGEEGLRSNPEHILITTGSQQALDLLGRVFIDRGDKIALEGPSYLGALTAFVTNGPDIITVSLDDEGMPVEELRQRLDHLEGPPLKFIYVVPNFHNPAGVTMSLARRHQLLDLAESRDLLIIEDNPYGLLCFEGEPLPPLASIDPKRVVYLGTLSKIISPGIRTGWVFGPAPIIEKLATLKQSADLCSSALNQMFAARYLQGGFWRKNVENLKPIYRSRRDAMLRALEKNFPDGSRWVRPQGGLFLWVTLPEFLDTEKMLPLAIDQKVAYVPGTAFFVDGSGLNQMRLNFSYADEDLIATGIKRLGKVIRKEIELYHSLGLDI